MQQGAPLSNGHIPSLEASALSSRVSRATPRWRWRVTAAGYDSCFRRKWSQVRFSQQLLEVNVIPSPSATLKCLAFLVEFLPSASVLLTCIPRCSARTPVPISTLPAAAVPAQCLVSRQGR